MNGESCDRHFALLRDGGDGPPDPAALAHLAGCPACAARFEREILDPLGAALRDAPAAPALPPFPRARLAAEAEREGRGMFRRLRDLLLFAPALRPALAFALLLLIALPLFPGGPAARRGPSAPAPPVAFVESLLPSSPLPWIDALVPAADPAGMETLLSLAGPADPAEAEALLSPAGPVDSAPRWPDTLAPPPDETGI